MHVVVWVGVSPLWIAVATCTVVDSCTYWLRCSSSCYFMLRTYCGNNAIADLCCAVLSTSWARLCAYASTSYGWLSVRSGCFYRPADDLPCISMTVSQCVCTITVKWNDLWPRIFVTLAHLDPYPGHGCRWEFMVTRKLFPFWPKVRMKLGKPVLEAWRKSGPELVTINNLFQPRVKAFLMWVSFLNCSQFARVRVSLCHYNFFGFRELRVSNSAVVWNDLSLRRPRVQWNVEPRPLTVGCCCAC